METIIVDTSNSKINNVRTYMFEILDSLLSGKNYQVNANFLSNDINNYSLDRLPVTKIVEQWIIPFKKYREVYEFRSRNSYGQDVIENLVNVGFFEAFEDIIYSNNQNKILPNIDGIDSIECLNCGAINIADTQECEFSVQIQINYIENKTNSSISL